VTAIATDLNWAIFPTDSKVSQLAKVLTALKGYDLPGVMTVV